MNAPLPMKKAYASAILLALCSMTLGGCQTAVAESRSSSLPPGVLLSGSSSLTPASPALTTAPQTANSNRSLSTLQTALGQWTTQNAKMRYSLSLDDGDRTGQMQTPLNWLNTIALKLTANRHRFTGFFDRPEQKNSSERIERDDLP
ncbi:MAG: hypothetical protein HY785_07205 [Oscillatoriophycideae cyanobacterium NC_groundwater_1537_Pr4_S-0.65um_50_18]|nr:hypothetical protein [Oscillatoriophycideae cyanobacterium NC_groundwater_1537_Pr4_S-0.65um_50_18]